MQNNGLNRIIGIDPGLRITGFGVIDVDSQGRYHYVTSGVIRTQGVELFERLKHIVDGLNVLIEQYQPHCAVIEKVFVNVNPQSTLLLGQARGAAIATLVSKDLQVFEYTALQLKKSVVGHGRASKEQVQMMVKELLSLEGKVSSDAADALGVAICHIHSRALFNKLQTVAGLPPLAQRQKTSRMRAGRWLG